VGEGVSTLTLEGTMDGASFDRMTRAIGGLTTRRRTLGGLAGGGVALILGQWGFEAGAQAKKCQAPNTKCGKKGCCTPAQECRGGVCLGACKFTKTSQTWTLQRDCLTRNPIDVPDGVTLDGDGHTIFMQGTPGSLPYGVGVQNAKAHVINLTLDGSGVTSASCAERGAGILFQNAIGAVRTSTITGFSASCGDAIRVIV